MPKRDRKAGFGEAVLNEAYGRNGRVRQEDDFVLGPIVHGGYEEESPATRPFEAYNGTLRTCRPAEVEGKSLQRQTIAQALAFIAPIVFPGIPLFN